MRRERSTRHRGLLVQPFKRSVPVQLNNEPGHECPEVLRRQAMTTSPVCHRAVVTLGAARSVPGDPASARRPRAELALLAGRNSDSLRTAAEKLRRSVGRQSRDRTARRDRGRRPRGLRTWPPNGSHHRPGADRRCVLGTTEFADLDASTVALIGNDELSPGPDSRDERRFRRRVLKAQGHGRIVVLSSGSGIRAVRAPNFVYGATTRALTACARLGDALAGSGVSVMVVRPGFVRTKMTTVARLRTRYSTRPTSPTQCARPGDRRGGGLGAFCAALRVRDLQARPRSVWRRMPG